MGDALFRRAASWAKERGCGMLTIETQNNNVPACGFYVAQGCELASINRFAYADLPDDLRGLAASTAGSGYVELANDALQTGDSVAAHASYQQAVDWYEKAMAKRLGEAIVRPDAAFVREATGFAIGGIPPFGHARPLVPRLDGDLLQYDTVWAAAGTPNAIFEVSPAALRDATRALVLQVT